MYRYVETEKVEGKTTRTGGITRRSLKALKHLPKVGKLRYVRGYIYTGRYGVQHIGVLVRGEKGSVRFGGFSWGYQGEGSRGLAELFKALNLPGLALRVFTLTEWPGFSRSDVGEHWRVTFNDDGTYTVFAKNSLAKAV